MNSYNNTKITILKKKKFSLFISFVFFALPLFFNPLFTQTASADDCDNDFGAVFRLPFKGTWGFSQGYNCAGTGCSHIVYASGFDLRNALDLTAWAGGVDTSLQPIFAPGDGKIIANAGGSTGDPDIVCFVFDDIKDDDGDVKQELGSMEIGHLSVPLTYPTGDIKRGEQIGNIYPRTGQTKVQHPHSTGPHLHIAYYPNNKNCSSHPSPAAPFDDIFGMDLSSNGTKNQWADKPDGTANTLGCGQMPVASPMDSQNILTEEEFQEVVDFCTGENVDPENEIACDMAYNEGTSTDQIKEILYKPIPYEAYVSRYHILLDTSTIVPFKGAIKDESFVAVILRVIREVVNYGPWFIALMVVWDGFLFITSAGDQSRIERARTGFRYIILGVMALLIILMILELIEPALLATV